MKSHSPSRKRGFTLLETVIAIGVLSVLLTGFIVVFAPAAAGIRKSLSVQEADRLVSTVEQEMVTLRAESPAYATGFDKAFEWIAQSNNSSDSTKALLVYQYRGNLTAALRTDKTPVPVANISSKVAGKEYNIQPMMRRANDTSFGGASGDLTAVEGGVYLVKCTQLVFDQATASLIQGTPGKIVDPKNPGTTIATSAAYPEAVILFSAEFFLLPSKTAAYFNDATKLAKFFDTTNPPKPVFTRNLAVRR